MLSQDLLSGARAASEFTGGIISERNIYAMVERGQLPVIRKGKRLYFRKSELEAAFRSDAAHGEA
ncbi:helix-turn-helix domain-containing protein [Sphingobium bisphenolivorans]|uniref:helix-turn-helix domain-containing protein n=1 Tax=Sphingobium bisphenolivorans TaxID=1335760 RepID=UPI0003A9682D|nr:helix-turn-helix domain-containing protein [Sphingobium bisphenolivorans]